MQAVPTQADEPQGALQHGFDLLRELDALRNALLDGRLLATTVRGLADLPEGKCGTIDAPRLQAVIEDVEPRAALELAKLQKD